MQKENEIPGETYNVIDSEEGLRDPLVFNDPYWPAQKTWYDLLKETYGSLEILRNTVFFMGKHCSHAFLNTAWF